MDYSFRYQNRIPTNSDKGRIKINPQGLLIKLFRLAHRIAPNKTPLIKSFLYWVDKHCKRKPFGAELSSDYNMNIYHITFSDYIEIGDISTLRQRLLTIAGQYPLGFLCRDAAKRINDFFDFSENSYNTASWGNLFSISTEKIKKMDLIDYISFNCLKGRNSHIFITYTVKPSQLCRNLFTKTLMSAQDEDEIYLLFNNLYDIFKRKSLIKSFGLKRLYNNYLCVQLFNEINWQFKVFLQKTVRDGILNKDKNKTLPYIVTYSYQPNGQDIRCKLSDFISIHPREIYTDGECISTFIELSDKPVEYNISLIIPEEKKEQGGITKLDATNFYKDFIALFNLLINVADNHKSQIVALQKNVYRYINKNKLSLFLKEDFKLKNHLTMGNIKLTRLLQDVMCSAWINELKDEMPLLKNKTHDNKEVAFGEQLIDSTQRYCDSLLQSYGELNQVCKDVNENNMLQANMRLQRILLWLALIGTILTIYGANSQYCNAKLLLGWNYLMSIGYYIRNFF